MEWLPSWIQDFFDGLVNLAKSAMLTLWDLLSDFLLFVLDTLFQVVAFMLDGMGELFAAADLTQYISSIPPDVANIMGLIGLGQAMSIIITAIIIRVLLQLIPFVRLGS